MKPAAAQCRIETARRPRILMESLFPAFEFPIEAQRRSAPHSRHLLKRFPGRGPAWMKAGSGNHVGLHSLSARWYSLRRAGRLLHALHRDLDGTDLVGPSGLPCREP